MWERLKGGGAILFGIASFIALLLVIALLINGGVYLGERIYPWLVKISGITLVVVLFLLLPLALFRRTRNFSGWGLSIASWVFGATLWVWGLLLTYQLWGWIALIIGLFLLGVGVVPIAMLATLFNGMWSTLGELVLLTAITFGIRLAGAFVLAKAETMSTTDFSEPPSTPRLSSNYFVRHWRGECSLGISYWVNGNVLAGIGTVALTVATHLLEKGGYSLRAISFAGLGTLLFSVIAWLWSSVGIWRSASHHVARGGSSGWASAARVGVVIGTIVMAGQLSTTILPQVKEFALIASGNDPIGNIKINVATNGQSVIVHGMLREGSALEVQKILDAAPGATSLVLNSAGGRTFEAKQLADVVQSRQLNTYVEDLCASACTYVFLAGKDRAATPNAQIGFHQPSFPGLDAAAQRAGTQTMLDVYRAAKLPEAFIQRIAKTPPEDIWYPTHDELIAAHVITRVSLGGEAAISGLGMRSKQELLLNLGSTPLFQAIEKRFPGTANEAVERGWAVKERGGTDADIQNAARIIISEIYPTLLKTADVSTLDSYIKLFISELSAAQAIRGEACAQLLVGKLNIHNTLPKEIFEQEQQLLLLALASPSTAALPPPDPDQFTQAMQKVRANLPEKYLNVVDDMNAYTNQPDLVCESMIGFFRTIDALPPRERHVALRGMFQGEDGKEKTPSEVIKEIGPTEGTGSKMKTDLATALGQYNKAVGVFPKEFLRFSAVQQEAYLRGALDGEYLLSEENKDKDPDRDAFVNCLNTRLKTILSEAKSFVEREGEHNNLMPWTLSSLVGQNCPEKTGIQAKTSPKYSEATTPTKLVFLQKQNLNETEFQREQAIIDNAFTRGVLDGKVFMLYGHGYSKFVDYLNCLSKPGNLDKISLSSGAYTQFGKNLDKSQAYGVTFAESLVCKELTE